MKPNHFTGRARNAFAAALMAAFALHAAGVTSPRAAELTPFKVGISAPVVTIFPVWMAEAGGLYEKQGLKVDVVTSEGGTRGLQVLLSGEIQVMHVGIAPLLQANTQGADLRAIASTSNTIPITVFAQPRIKGAQDLKGGTVGISTFGSETDIAVSLALRQLGLSRQDVTISQIGGSSQRFAALSAGRVDAVPLLEPAITLAKQKNFNMLVDLAAAKTPWIFDAVVVSRSYLKDKPDLVMRFLKAYVEGAYLALSDEKKAKEVIAQRFKTNDPVVIEATYQDFKRLMPLDAAPSAEGARNAMDQLEATGVKVGSRNVADHLDLAPIEKLKQEGFFAELAKKYNVK